MRKVSSPIIRVSLPIGHTDIEKTKGRREAVFVYDPEKEYGSPLIFLVICIENATFVYAKRLKKLDEIRGISLTIRDQNGMIITIVGIPKCQ